MQADDFFNAYRILEENEQAVIKKLGQLNGKPLVSKTAYGGAPTGSAGITCLAFSIELYIKYLHSITRGKAPQGHNILKLFRNLPKDVKHKIRQEPAIIKTISFYSMEIPKVYPPLNKKGPPVTDVFEQQLYKIADAYEKWRYSYESRAVRYDKGFALEFIDALRSVTKHLKENKTKT